MDSSVAHERKCTGGPSSPVGDPPARGDASSRQEQWKTVLYPGSRLPGCICSSECCEFESRGARVTDKTRITTRRDVQDGSGGPRSDRRVKRERMGGCPRRCGPRAIRGRERDREEGREPGRTRG